MYVWQGDVNAAATLVTDRRLSPTSLVATDERFLVQIGGADLSGDAYDVNFPTRPSQRTVLWPSQETLTDWTPTAENSAGSFPLATDGALLAGRKSRGQTLLWTTTDLHTMTYIGGDFVFRFQQAGSQCGAISIRSPIVTDSAAFWMGVNGFFAYDGFVKPLPCEVSDYVFGNFNRDLAYLIWGYSNPQFGEVTWHYASASATTLDRYVTYNYRENHWTFGALARMGGVSAQPPGTVPVLVDAAGVVYDHETGTARDSEWGTPMSVATTDGNPFQTQDGDDLVITSGEAMLESGPIELGTGDQVMHVQSLVPDERTLGSVSAQLLASMRPMGQESSHGPLTLTEKTDLRVTAREVRLKLTEVTPADWRVGLLRLGVQPGGRR
jgi:hypothetical protein